METTVESIILLELLYLLRLCRISLLNPLLILSIRLSNINRIQHQRRTTLPILLCILNLYQPRLIHRMLITQFSQPWVLMVNPYTRPLPKWRMLRLRCIHLTVPTLLPAQCTPATPYPSLLLLHRPLLGLLSLLLPFKPPVFSLI